MENATPPSDAQQAIARVENYQPPAPVQPEGITQKQARVEAVAQLVSTAMQKAGQLELTDGQIAALQERFPDEAFKGGASGKEHLIYIEHAFLRQRLNSVIGIGKWALIQKERWAEDSEYEKNGQWKKQTRIYVEAMLLIQGCFVAESIGEMIYYPDSASRSYGDAVEGAKTAALRRCCKEIGVGLQAWEEDFVNGWWERWETKTGQQRPSGAYHDRGRQGSYGSRPPNRPAPAKPKSASTAAQATPQGSAAPPATGPNAFRLVKPMEGLGRVVDIEERDPAPGYTGRPWHAWIVTLENNAGEQFQATTFEKAIGFDANTAFAEGLGVSFKVEPGNKPGRINLLDLRPVAAQQPPTTAAAEPEDDIPM